MDVTTKDENVVTLEEQKLKPARKRQRVYGEKNCQICGDKALAHHFGILACETCKAFFRRNALSKDQRKCLFKGDCPIDVKTRRFCPACRLSKCFKMGMQAELILGEQEKKLRLQKITEKKSQRESSKEEKLSDSSTTNIISEQAACTVTTTDPDSSRTSDLVSSVMEQAWAAAGATTDIEMSLMHSPMSMDTQWGQGLLSAEAGHLDIFSSCAGNMESEQDSKMTMYSGREGFVPIAQTEFSCAPPTPASSELYQPQPCAMPTLPPSVSQQQNHENSSDVVTQLTMQHHKISSAFQHISRDALPSDPYMYWRLSEEERNLLTQLAAAYQDTILSVLLQSPPREVIHSDLISPEFCLQEFEQEARSAISFAKRMEDFCMLRMEEQIALLKASTYQVLGLRSSALFVAEKQAWLTRSGYFTVQQIEAMLPNHPTLDLGLSFCQTMKSIVKNDVTLYALLHCVVLFDPSDERIIDHQLINSIRDKYIILLRHYLESIYSYAHSDKYVMALQENLVFYRDLCLEDKPLIKKFFPSIPHKLLIEVLDLE